MRDRLVKLLNAVECDGEETFGNCPQRRDGQCGTVQKLEMCQIGAIADHLRANGVIAPPCKVGDTVYAIACWHGRYVIRDVEVCNYTIFENDWKIVDLYGDYWSANNFGKTFFRTREEAERALKEKE